MKRLCNIVILLLALAATGVAGDAPETIVLDAKDAKIENNGGAARYETVTNRLCIGYWGSTSIVVRWSFDVPARAAYRVIVVQACGPDSPGSMYEVMVAGQRANGAVEMTGDWGKFTEVDLGPVLLRRTGPAELTVRGTLKPGRSIMNLRAVKLVSEK